MNTRSENPENRNVPDSPKHIPALQTPVFATRIQDCLMNEVRKMVFHWQVPRDVFSKGLFPTQSHPTSLTYDYVGRFVSLMGAINCLEQISDIDDISFQTYLQTYFCRADYPNDCGNADDSQRLTLHDEAAQEYFLNSQNYRAFYDFDEQVGGVIRQIVKDAREKYDNGTSLQDVQAFLEETMNEILDPYVVFFHSEATETAELEISYRPLHGPKIVLILKVSNIPVQEYQNLRGRHPLI